MSVGNSRDWSIVLEIVQNHMIFIEFAKEFQLQITKDFITFFADWQIYDRNRKIPTCSHRQRTVYLPLNLKSLLALSWQTLLKFACQHFGRHQHHHRVAPMRKSKSKPQLSDIKIITKSKSNSKSTIFAVVETVFFIRNSLPRCTICHGAPDTVYTFNTGTLPAPPHSHSLSAVLWQNAQWCEILTDCAPLR